MASGGGSVSKLIAQLRKGQPEAAQKLWEAYFQRLVGLALHKLRGTPRRIADEQDVALSAMDSLFRGVERGRFPQLEDRTDLWRLLVVITTRKAADVANHERRQKRGGGLVQGESALRAVGDEPGIEQIASREPTPDFVAQVDEEFNRLLQKLEDADLCSVAKWKLEGYTNAEIASRLNCVERTVERKLELIRNIWSRESTK